MDQRASAPPGSDHPAPAHADPMDGRIIRFRDLPGHAIPLMFIDSVLPGHERLNFALIGDTASENPEFNPLVSAPHAFQIGMVKARPGNGPAYHTHDYVESFLVLSGRWRFYWGEDPDPDHATGETTLEPWDFITLPPHLFRGFEVATDETEDAWIFAVLEPHATFASKDPIWSPWVVAEAEAHGFRADENGKMIHPPDYAARRAELMAKLGG